MSETETCACGASRTANSGSPTRDDETIYRWRKRHVCPLAANASQIDNQRHVPWFIDVRTGVMFCSRCGKYYEEQEVER